MIAIAVLSAAALLALALLWVLFRPVDTGAAIVLDELSEHANSLPLESVRNSLDRAIRAGTLLAKPSLGQQLTISPLTDEFFRAVGRLDWPQRELTLSLENVRQLEPFAGRTTIAIGEINGGHAAIIALIGDDRVGLIEDNLRVEEARWFKSIYHFMQFQLAYHVRIEDESRGSGDQFDS